VVDRAQNHDHVRLRQLARVSSLKRRSLVASVLGFAALFGLAAQHAVTGSSSASGPDVSSARGAATPTSFFDQQGEGFAFDDQGFGSGGSAVSPAPPVTQSSVS
jgi:hypothetical protein